MKCLDTDLLVAILRGDEGAKDTIAELDEEGLRHSTTAVNVFELFYGANRSSKRSENIEKVRALVRRLQIEHLSLDAAERAGEILAKLTLKGEVIDFRDALIAGIVLERGLDLVTRNKKHFARIPEMQVETW